MRIQVLKIRDSVCEKEGPLRIFFIISSTKRRDSSQLTEAITGYRLPFVLLTKQLMIGQRMAILVSQPITSNNQIEILQILRLLSKLNTAIT